MQDLPIGPEQRIVGRVPDQRMAEQIGTRGRQATLAEKAGQYHLMKARAQFGVRLCRDRAKQIIAESPTDHRADIGYPAGRTEVIKPGDK